MTGLVLDGVTVAPGDGRPVIVGGRVTVDGDGVVVGLEDGGRPTEWLLLPAAVDLHLDNVRERRRPRATVELDLPTVIAALDAECAASGIGLVCVAARCEDEPAKGVLPEDAVELASVVEELAPDLACDWRVHARVEVTDDSAVDALTRVLSVSSRVVLVSVMEHSVDRTRFASAEAHREFYAEDWGVRPDQVDAILAAKRAGSAGSKDRRSAVAAMALRAGIPIASHDDRTPDDVDDAFELGATIAEFPITMPAARRARELGMATVLGAPNVVRRRSTAPGNLLAVDAIAAGVCDVLCSDYLPAALQQAATILDADGVVDLARSVELVSGAPAALLGLERPTIEVGRPLNATLRKVGRDVHVGVALWRGGRLVFSRPDALGVATAQTVGL